MRALPWLLGLLVACGGSSKDSGPSTTTGDPTGSGTGSATAGPGTGTGTGTGAATGTGTGTGGTTASAPWDCAPLDPPTGPVITIPSGDAAALATAVGTAQPGDTIVLEDGTYFLDGGYLWVDTPGVTIRGQSGDASAVILDGNYNTTEIITILADDVTVAHLTTWRAWTHGIHATGGVTDVTGTVIYDVTVLDPGEQAIKINQSGTGTWTDDGVVACSNLVLTDTGRPQVRNCYTGGIDSHATRGWTLRDNHVEGFWCDSGLSEHGIHLWRKNAETVIERNTIVDCARGIGLGLSESPGAFDRDHGIDCGPAYVDDIRGTVRNNTVLVTDPRIDASGAGYDVGIGIWNACEAVVVHNTVFSTFAPYSSIEWRFDPTSAHVANNLVSHNLRERTAGIATVEGNLEDAAADGFVDAPGGDLRLDPASAAVDAGVVLSPGLADHDLDGQARTGTPDVGADEL